MRKLLLLSSLFSFAACASAADKDRHSDVLYLVCKGEANYYVNGFGNEVRREKDSQGFLILNKTNKTVEIIPTMVGKVTASYTDDGVSYRGSSRIETDSPVRAVSFQLNRLTGTMLISYQVDGSSYVGFYGKCERTERRF